MLNAKKPGILQCQAYNIVEYRPSWLRAAKHEISVPLYEEFCKKLSESLGKPVGTGEFGADMKVDLLNDGPVTIMMDTHNKE